MAMTKVECAGIWVLAEQTNGILSTTALELLSKALELKKSLGGTEEITAVLLGYQVGQLAETLFSYGADQVLLAEHVNLETYKPRPYKKGLVELAHKYKPSIFLIPSTPLGRDLAPRVMCALDTGLTADAIDLSFDEDGIFVHTTPAYGGTILVNIAIPEKRPQMVTVRPQVFSPITPIAGKTGEVIREFISVEDDEAYVIVDTEEKVNDNTALPAARVVVSGGRGIKSEADLEMLRQLAKLLGGQVGCSRPLCDNGWMPHEAQIGQSGVTVKPDLILNVGVSGAGQYTAGMNQSGCVMSINYTAEAPIFSTSHYGVVMDYRTVIPALVAEIKQRKGI